MGETGMKGKGKDKERVEGLTFTADLWSCPTF